MLSTVLVSGGVLFYRKKVLKKIPGDMVFLGDGKNRKNEEKSLKTSN